jgi:outer membrane protein assembly factor BamB
MIGSAQMSSMPVSGFGSWCLPILWLTMALSEALAEDWPRWRGVRGDGTWNGPAGLTEGTFPSGDLNIVWKTAIGPGYSGVTATRGLVYTMDRVANDQLERVRCFDAETGEEKWHVAYEAPYGDLDYGSGPRASVTLHDGKAYAFGAVGHLHCLDAQTGEVIWKRDTVKDLGAKYNTWGFSSAPLVYKDTLIMQLGIPGGGCYIALDRATGDERWRSVDDPAGYATPALFSFEGKDQLACWTPTHIRGLSAADGTPLWAVPFGVKYGVYIAMPIVHDNIVVIKGCWAGSKAIHLDAE